jgi:hypothetical protein
MLGWEKKKSWHIEACSISSMPGWQKVVYAALLCLRHMYGVITKCYCYSGTHDEAYTLHVLHPMLVHWRRVQLFRGTIGDDAVAALKSCQCQLRSTLGSSAMVNFEHTRHILYSCYKSMVNNRAKYLAISQVIRAKLYNSCFLFSYKKVFYY